VPIRLDFDESAAFSPPGPEHFRLQRKRRYFSALLLTRADSTRDDFSRLLESILFLFETSSGDTE